MQRTRSLGFATVPLSLLGTLIVLLWTLVGCGQQGPAKQTGSEINGTATTTTNGLTGEYYDNVDFTGNKVTRVDSTIDKVFPRDGSPLVGIAANTYSVRWTGQIQPKYSETYTFYLTADDGMRLMVNGQVLVNNWVNGTATKSGIVTLKAGVKYDLRLEYYQNTGGAQVKLEWQSSSQLRQIVPTTSLFPSTAQLSSALSILSGHTNVVALHTSFNSLNSYVYNTPVGIVVMAKEQTGTGSITAVINNGKIVYAIRQQFDLNTGNGIAKNLLTQQSADLGLMSQYGNPDGTQTLAQRSALQSKLMSITISSDGLTTLSYTTTQSRIQTQSFIGNTCAACQTQYDDWNRKEMNLAGATGSTLFGALAAARSFFTTGQLNWDVIVGGGGAASGFLTIPAARADRDAARDAYQICRNKAEHCPAVMVGPTIVGPTMPIRVHVGQSWNVPVIVSNADVAQSVLLFNFSGYGVSSFDANQQNWQGPLESTYRNGLLPSAEVRFYSVGICPITPTTQRGTVSVTSNDPIRPTATVDIEVICFDDASMSDPTPNPVNLTAPVGGSAVQDVTFTNTGTADLIFSATASGPHLTLSYPNGTNIAPGHTGIIHIHGNCDVSSGNNPFPYSIILSSNNGKSISLPVNLICTSNVTTIIITGLSYNYKYGPTNLNKSVIKLVTYRLVNWKGDGGVSTEITACYVCSDGNYDTSPDVEAAQRGLEYSYAPSGYFPSNGSWINSISYRDITGISGYVVN